MPPNGDLLSARVAHEREWCVQAWDARLTYPEMRRLANEPPERGGLGYDLSLSALKGLVEQGRQDRGDLTMSKADRVERQQAEVDALARAARNDFDRAQKMMREPRPQRGDFYSSEHYLDALAAWAKTIEAGARTIETTHRRLDAAHKREAALHGLDAPSRAELDVTTHDAVDAELEAMLARLDPKKAKK